MLAVSGAADPHGEADHRGRKPLEATSRGRCEAHRFARLTDGPEGASFPGRLRAQRASSGPPCRSRRGPSAFGGVGATGGLTSFGSIAAGAAWTSALRV